MLFLEQFPDPLELNPQLHLKANHVKRKGRGWIKTLDQKPTDALKPNTLRSRRSYIDYIYMYIDISKHSSQNQVLGKEDQGHEREHTPQRALNTGMLPGFPVNFINNST